MSGYDIIVDENLNKIYIKIMFGFIGVLSLVLSVLYIKRIRELE